MSSPFQKQFSAKSPLNGNYYSGVDGLQYVSPKIPESKTPADTTSKTKVPEIPETKKTFDFGSTPTIPSIEIPESNFKFGGGGTPDLAEIPKTPGDVMKNREEIINERTLKRIVPGAKVEKIEIDKKKYLKSFEPGFARDPEGATTIEEYIRKKEGKYKDRTLYQDQEQTGFTENSETTLGDFMNVGEEYEKQ
jgi:hypothetical protein